MHSPLRSNSLPSSIRSEVISLSPINCWKPRRFRQRVPRLTCIPRWVSGKCDNPYINMFLINVVASMVVFYSAWSSCLIIKQFFSTWLVLVEYLNDRPEVSGNAEDDYQHGIVDIKSIGYKGQDTHRPHDLQKSWSRWESVRQIKHNSMCC